MIRLRAVRLLLGGGWLLLPGCGEQAPPPLPAPDPPAPGVVLAFDGLAVLGAEIDEWLPYLESIDRHLGRRAMVRTVLARHVVPLKLAARDLQAERAPLLERAQALARVVGNGGFPELLAKGRTYGAERPETGWRRGELPLVLQRYVFDEQNVGQVSPVLALPQGYALAATFELRPGPTRLEDRADACIVMFYTHAARAFGEWLAAATRRPLPVAYVHPDLAESLPEYLRP